RGVGLAVAGWGQGRTGGYHGGLRVSGRLWVAIASCRGGTGAARKASFAPVRERAGVDEQEAVASHRGRLSRSTGVVGGGYPHRGPGGRIDGCRAGWCETGGLPTRRRPGQRTSSTVPGRREDPYRAFNGAGVDHGIDTL